MKRLVLLLCALGVLSSLCLAQKGPEPEAKFQSLAGERIVYTPRIPTAIARERARGARTLFYGSAPKQKLAFHFWAIPARKTTEFWQQVQARLDIYESGQTPRRLNSIALALSLAPDHRFGMMFYFSDAANQKWPLLVLSQFRYNNEGDSGDQTFFAFRGGWKTPPTRLDLQFGGWRASDVSGQNNTVGRDENGRLAIEISLSPTTGEWEFIDPRDYRALLVWNGQKFQAAPPIGKIALGYVPAANR